MTNLHYYLIIHLLIGSFISGYCWLALKDAKILYRIGICILVFGLGIIAVLLDLIYEVMSDKKL